MLALFKCVSSLQVILGAKRTWPSPSRRLEVWLFLEFGGGELKCGTVALLPRGFGHNTEVLCLLYK